MAAGSNYRSFHQVLAATLHADFERLLTRFTETNSVRFEWFVHIWKDMKMSFLFYGHRKVIKLREFTQATFRQASHFLLSQYTFQVRVGALYLLYSLYYKQLSNPKVKMRVTHEQWNDLLLFYDEIKKQTHLDVEYVFLKLCLNSAFHFVSNTSPMIPRMRDNQEEAQTHEMLVNRNSILTEILDQSNIAQLAAIHEQYSHVKCALAGPGATQPDTSLSVINDDLMESVTRCITKHEDWRRKHFLKMNKRSKGKKKAHPTTSESEQESTGSDSDYRPKQSSRAAVRARAFEKGAGTTRSRRHRKVQISDVSSPENASRKRQTKTAKKQQQGKAKKATKFELQDSEVEVGADIVIKSEPLSMPVLVQDQESPQAKRGKLGKTPKRGRKPKGSKKSDTSIEYADVGKEEMLSELDSPSLSMPLLVTDENTSQTKVKRGKSGKIPKKGKKSQGSKKSDTSVEFADVTKQEMLSEVDSPSLSMPLLVTDESTSQTKGKRGRKPGSIRVVLSPKKGSKRKAKQDAEQPTPKKKK